MNVRVINLQYIKLYFIGTLFSSIFFLIFFCLYAVFLGEEIDYLSLPFMFVFVFSIYLLIANPITVLVQILLKKYFWYHIILLTIIVSIVSLLINYGMAVNINMDLSLPTSNILAGNYIHFIIYSFITALPSVFGVEFFNRS